MRQSVEPLIGFLVLLRGISVNKIIIKILYSFYVKNIKLSLIGLERNKREDIIRKVVGYQVCPDDDKANKRIKSFLNKYLTCLKG